MLGWSFYAVLPDTTSINTLLTQDTFVLLFPYEMISTYITYIQIHIKS